MACHETGVKTRVDWPLGPLSGTACRLILDKGKPVARPGRKATGRVRENTVAGLPKG